MRGALVVGLAALLLVAPAVTASAVDSQWYLDAIGVRGLAEQGLDGSGVTIAVLDSGIEKTHPDLVGSFWTNPGEVPGNGLDDDNNGYVDDVDGWDMCHDAPLRTIPPFVHGTFVAGIITADGAGPDRTVGVAPSARTMDLQVFCDDARYPDRDPLLDSDALREGMRYAIDNGADIIHMSLQLWDDQGASLVDILFGAEEEFQRANDEGILIVVAAGNFAARGPSSPGDQPHTITVGATSGCGFKAAYSNYGPDIDIWAPGTVRSTTLDGGWEWSYGTSFAAPLVTGAAALLMQDGMSDPDRIVGELRRLAREEAYGPALDLHGRWNLAYPEVPESIQYLGPDIISGKHYLQFTGPDAPLINIRFPEVDNQWCLRSEHFSEQSFFVRDLQDDGEVIVEARLHNGVEASPWLTVSLGYDPELPNAEEVPLWVPMGDEDEGRGAPMAPITLVGVLLLAAVAVRRLD